MIEPHSKMSKIPFVYLSFLIFFSSTRSCLAFFFSFAKKKTLSTFFQLVYSG